MKKININVFAYWATIIFIFLLLLETFNILDYSGERNQWGFYELCNSDSLVLNAYCRDIIGDIKNLLTWNLGTTLWFFPNTLLMVIIELFTKNNILSQVIYGIIQVFLIIFISNYIFKTILPNISKQYLIISNICLSLFFIHTVAYIDFVDFTSNLIVPYHTGAFIGTLLSLVFIFRYFISGENKYLIIFSLLSAISIISDGLTCIYLNIPILITLFISIFWYKDFYYTRIKKLFFINLIVLVVGYLLQKWLQPLFNINFNGLGFISTDSIISAYKILFWQFKIYITAGGIQSLIIYLSIISLIASLIISIFLFTKQNKNKSIYESLFFIYFLFSFISIFITFIAPVVFGVYGGPFSIRYNIVSLYLSLLNIGFIFAYLNYSNILKEIYLKVFFWLTFIAFGYFVTYNAIKNNPTQVFTKINSFYPSFIKATDEFSKTYQCKNGVGNHWDARFVTSLSKQKVLVNTVFDNLIPWQFANNRNRYYWTKNKQVVYNFIVLKSITDTTEIHKIFGTKNIKKVTINGYSFYKVPNFIFDINNNNAITLVTPL